MNLKELLHQFCYDVLSDTDIRALAKARGFSNREIASRSQLETYFLSSIGIEKVMSGLNSAEVATLHLLHVIGTPVNIETFQRLYDPEFDSDRRWNQTYNQRYQQTLKLVRKNLVRKGILLMGEANMAESTRMERWLFHFPREFVPFLTAPFAETHTLADAGHTRHNVARDKLCALVKEVKSPGLPLPGYELKLRGGRLLMGNELFSADRLVAWRADNWQLALPRAETRNRRLFEVVGHQFGALEAVMYALTQLPPQQWIAPDQLKTILTIFTGRTQDVDHLCKQGYEWGHLARNSVAGQTVYRLADVGTAEESPAPDRYFTPVGEDAVAVDLDTIPYDVLDRLNRVATFKLDGRQLIASPNRIEMSKGLDSIKDNPPLQWLVQHVAAFGEAYKTLKGRWGKNIIHTNLLFARVTDITLRIKIMHTLKSDEVLELDEEYIAFPPRLLAKIERIVQRDGHVIKEGKWA